MTEKELNDLGYEIIGAAFAVRTNSEPYLLESYYELAMEYELGLKGHKVKRQVSVPIKYRDVELEGSLRIDMLVDDEIIIEFKSVSEVKSEAFKQLKTYLVLTGKRLGYVMNFAAKNFRVEKVPPTGPYKAGIYRVVNKI